MNIPRLILSVLLVTLLPACGTTPPSQYYMLTADAVGTPGKADISIGVGPVAVPDYLKGRSMVLARDDHLLKVSDFDRWAEPLEAGVLRVLTLNLAVLMDTQQVSTFPWRSDSIPEYGVRVTIIQAAAGQGSAHLAASWSVHRPLSGELVYKALSQLDAPLADNSAGNVADVYSRLLLALSEEIAAVITRDRGNS